jgi:hypothetical protein
MENWTISILEASSNLQQARQLEEQQYQSNQFQYLEIDSSDK